MKDSLIRAVRTFFQAFIGAFAMIAVPAATGTIGTIQAGNDVVIDLNIYTGALIAGGLAGMVALVSFIQNALEDKTGKTALK